MEQRKNKHIIISGGGTGGHIFPALAIADALKKKYPDAEILFVGAEGRMEMEKVPASGYKIIGLPITGLQRKNMFKNIQFLINLYKSIQKSKKIITEFKPDIVIGVGGYASFAVLRIATKKGIPTVIQEQNSYAGVTNKMLAKKVNSICVAYDNMGKYFPPEKIIKTGNPVRKDILDIQSKKQQAYEYFNLEQGKKVVLMIGGSLGAGTLNKSALKHIKELSDANIQFIWQTGKHYYNNVKQESDKFGNKDIKVYDFISKMDLAYAAADIIISRAGALSISELCLVGKPIILVPSPNVAEDHQTKNAMALVNQNAAIIVNDKNAEEQLIKELIQLLSNNQLSNELASNCKKLGIADSTDRIINVISKTIKE